MSIELIDSSQPELANTIYRRATIRRDVNDSLHDVQDEESGILRFLKDCMI